MAGVLKTTTTDSLYEGAVRLRQPARGYRVNVDAVILADFAAQGPHADFALDLGSGVGSVALGLHHLEAASRFAMLDRERPLLLLADDNARHANMVSRSFCHDLALGLPAELRQAADLVVSNPPFFDPQNLRKSSDLPKARARFGEIEPFLAAAASAVSGARTRVAFVYPARELCRFLASAERVSLVPKRLRLVHADGESPARVALIELRRAKPGGLVVLPPLIEWTSRSVRSPELVRILAGKR